MLERVARASWGPWSDKLEGSHRRTFEDDNSALRHYAVALPPVTLTRNGHPSNEIVVNANAVGLHEPQTFAKGSWPRSARLHGSVQREMSDRALVAWAILSTLRPSLPVLTCEERRPSLPWCPSKTLLRSFVQPWCYSARPSQRSKSRLHWPPVARGALRTYE